MRSPVLFSLLLISSLIFSAGAYRYSPILTLHGYLGYDVWEGLYRYEYEEENHYESGTRAFVMLSPEGGAGLGLIVPFPNTQFVLDLNGRIWKNFKGIFISDETEGQSEVVEIGDLGYILGLGIGSGYELRPIGNTGKVDKIVVETLGAFYGVIPSMDYAMRSVGNQGIAEGIFGVFLKRLTIMGGFSFELFETLMFHMNEDEGLKILGAQIQIGIGLGAYGTNPINP